MRVVRVREEASEMSHKDSRVKAMRLNEFSKRTYRREDGEEDQGQILRENLSLELEKKRKWRRHRDKRGDKKSIKVRIAQAWGHSWGWGEQAQSYKVTKQNENKTKNTAFGNRLTIDL